MWRGCSGPPRCQSSRAVTPGDNRDRHEHSPSARTSSFFDLSRTNSSSCSFRAVLLESRSASGLCPARPPPLAPAVPRDPRASCPRLGYPRSHPVPCLISGGTHHEADVAPATPDPRFPFPRILSSHPCPGLSPVPPALSSSLSTFSPSSLRAPRAPHRVLPGPARRPRRGPARPGRGPAAPTWPGLTDTPPWAPPSCPGASAECRARAEGASAESIDGGPGPAPLPGFDAVPDL